MTIVSAGPAHAATTVVADIGREAPIAASSTHLAFSLYDGKTNSFRLMIGDRTEAPIAIAAARVKTSRKPFDVSLGTLGGRRVALYSRCARAGCDVYSYSLTSRRETKLIRVSSPSFDESSPVVTPSGKEIGFVRRLSKRVKTGFTRGPKTKKIDCDRVYIRAVTGSRPSRALARPVCGSLSQLAATDGKLAAVVSTDPDLDGGQWIVVLSADGRGGRAIGRLASGEGGSSSYGGLTFTSSTQLVASRAGYRQGSPDGFLRFDLTQSKPAPKVSPTTNRMGEFAVAGDDWFWLEGAPAGDGFGLVCGPDNEAALSPPGTPEGDLVYGPAPCALVQGAGPGF